MYNPKQSATHQGYKKNKQVRLKQVHSEFEWNKDVLSEKSVSSLGEYGRGAALVCVRVQQYASRQPAQEIVTPDQFPRGLLRKVLLSVLRKDIRGSWSTTPSSSRGIYTISLVVFIHSITFYHFAFYPSNQIGVIFVKVLFSVVVFTYIDRDVPCIRKLVRVYECELKYDAACDVQNNTNLLVGYLIHYNTIFV